jgi:hypothetical protein
MPWAQLRGNELLLRKVLLSGIQGILSIGALGNVNIIAIPTEYTTDSCTIEFSIQISWLQLPENVSKDISLPISLAQKERINPSFFNLLCHYQYLAMAIETANYRQNIQYPHKRGFKVSFALDFKKIL